MSHKSDTVKNEFQRVFRRKPLVVRSPGRVNLIGEHTDYNLGYVLPAAIDKAIYLAVAPRGDHRCVVRALDLNDQCEFDLTHIEASPKGWPNYLMGVADQFVKAGHVLKGFDCLFSGDIPIGAGLSSSAALEAGLAFALNKTFEVGLDVLSLAKLAQRAENEFVGVGCGIMDQFTNLFGVPETVLLLDCRNLKSRTYPFNFRNVSIMLFDTGISHSLATSEYNLRRKECEQGVQILHRKFPSVASLRDATSHMIDLSRTELGPDVSLRCRYVVQENERVLQACEALERGDLLAFGAAMRASHAGLRDEYKVSCPELDFLVDSVSSDPQVFGSRMMGGGFGGCTINLVDSGSVQHLRAAVSEQYQRRFQRELRTYVVEISSGTNIVNFE